MSMRPLEIIRAVDEGLRVCWQCPAYEVIRGSRAHEYYIKSQGTGHCISLLQSDRSTLNGREEDFYVETPSAIHM